MERRGPLRVMASGESGKMRAAGWDTQGYRWGRELGTWHERSLEKETKVGCGKEEGPSPYLDPMTNIIQAAKVEGSPVVGREGWEAVGGNDFLARGQPLDRGQSADLPSGHLLHVHVHHLPRQGLRQQWARLCTAPFL